MAISTQKEQEREEIHRSVWSIADDLRGAVDGWDFKSYVLGAMFYRYISENLTAYINKGEIEIGNENFDYAALSDVVAEEAREGLVEEKGFFMLPSELFVNVHRNASNNPNNLNTTLEKVFRNIEASAQGGDFEDQFKGLFADFDVNSNKLGSSVHKKNERLAAILNGIAEMNLGSFENHEVDAIGDAYEYLMSMYASNAGKSGGEFFTPADVSELLMRLGTVGKSKVSKVYDPACGSGSLLLKAIKILKGGVELGFFGQEINVTTYNLCRINMFLHNLNPDKFNIACDDTLTNPAHWDAEPFDLIVSNPPYSIKWAGDSNPLLINDPRFAPAGVLAPKSKADMAFIMHALAWLAPNGTAAIVCFPGIMYRSGAEQKIRQYLVDYNFVDAVIQLPPNLFFGTSIATCVLVMKRSKLDNSVIFIDASREFLKSTNNNRLAPENIARIIDAFAARTDRQFFCRLVPADEIRAQNYNLAVSTYVAQENKREKVDIAQLNAQINQIVAREQVLRNSIDKIVAEIEG